MRLNPYFNGFIQCNAFKVNPDKSHLLLNSPDNNLSAIIGSHTINNSNNVKLLGITIDNELKFNVHVSKLCKQASQKLHALSYMNENKRRIIMKAFITISIWLLSPRMDVSQSCLKFSYK